MDIRTPVLSVVVMFAIFGSMLAVLWAYEHLLYPDKTTKAQVLCEHFGMRAWHWTNCQVGNNVRLRSEIIWINETPYIEIGI